MGHNGSAVGRSPKISEPEDKTCAWLLPGSGAVFTMPASVVTQLKDKVTAGLLLLPKRGAEVGGILLGRVVERNPLVVDITGFEPVSCEYRFGPTFVLSETDLAGLRPILARLTAHREDSVVGFYRSCTGRQQSLENADLELLQNYFPGPDAIVLSIKPISLRESEIWFFVQQNGTMPTEPTHSALPFEETSKVEALSSTSLEAPDGLALLAEHEQAAERAPEVEEEEFMGAGGEQFPVEVEGLLQAEVVDEARPVLTPLDERSPEVDFVSALADESQPEVEVVSASVIERPSGLEVVSTPVVERQPEVEVVSAPVDERPPQREVVSASVVERQAEPEVVSAPVIATLGETPVSAPWETPAADSEDAEAPIPLARSAWQWIVVTCILLIVAGAGFYLVTSTSSPESQVPAPTPVVVAPKQNQPPVTVAATTPAPAQAPVPAKPLPAVIPAAVLQQATPEVPAGIRARVESPVVINVQVFVDAAGRVTGAVAKGDGNSVFRFLAERAVSAAQASRFKPGRAANGTPVPSTAVLTYVFEPDQR